MDVFLLNKIYSSIVSGKIYYKNIFGFLTFFHPLVFSKSSYRKSHKQQTHLF